MIARKQSLLTMPSLVYAKFSLFFCFFYFLTSIHGTVVGVGVLLAVTLCLVCPIGVVAGVSVSLATHVLFFLHSLGRVARAGVPLVVHPFF